MTYEAEYNRESATAETLRQLAVAKAVFQQRTVKEYLTAGYVAQARKVT